MNIIFSILNILLIILLCIIFLLLWIIIAPRHFFIEYTKLEGLIIKINLAFFKLKIFEYKIEDEDENLAKEDLVKEDLVKQDLTKEVLEEKIPISKTATQELSRPIEDNSKENKENETITKQNDEPLKNSSKADNVTKKKAKKPKRDKKAKKTSILDDFNDKNLSFTEIFSIIKDIVNSTKGFMRILFNRIKFTDVSFTIPINSSDANSTQKLYAITTNSFYTLATFLQSNLKINFKSPIFIADFENNYKDSVYAYIKITAQTGILIFVAVYVFKQYKFYKTKYLTQKGE